MDEKPSTSTQISEEDCRSTEAALNEIADRATDCAALVEALAYKVKSKEMSTAEGMSFLEVKNHLLLQYIIGISGVVLKKVYGKSIQEGPFVDQLVELRTVMEKIRPIDQKLKYQIEKLLRNAADGKSESDPLQHKANLDNIEDDSAEEESEDDEESGVKNKKAIYQPPKVAALPYDDDDETPAKQVEKSRTRSINRSLIREMQEEFLDTPVEIHNGGDAFAMQISKEAKDKQRFEETYMTRLPETKKDKHRAKAISTIGILGDEITNFKTKRSSTRGSVKSVKGTKRKRSKSAGGKSKKMFRKK